jgi:hypothetical protein
LGRPCQSFSVSEKVTRLSRCNSEVRKKETDSTGLSLALSSRSSRIELGRTSLICTWYGNLSPSYGIQTTPLSRREIAVRSERTPPEKSSGLPTACSPASNSQ